MNIMYFDQIYSLMNPYSFSSISLQPLSCRFICFLKKLTSPSKHEYMTHWSMGRLRGGPNRSHIPEENWFSSSQQTSMAKDPILRGISWASPPSILWLLIGMFMYLSYICSTNTIISVKYCFPAEISSSCSCSLSVTPAPMWWHRAYVIGSYRFFFWNSWYYQGWVPSYLVGQLLNPIRMLLFTPIIFVPLLH